VCQSLICFFTVDLYVSASWIEYQNINILTEPVVLPHRLRYRYSTGAVQYAAGTEKFVHPDRPRKAQDQSAVLVLFFIDGREGDSSADSGVVIERQCRTELCPKIIGLKCWGSRICCSDSLGGHGSPQPVSYQGIVIRSGTLWNQTVRDSVTPKSKIKSRRQVVVPLILSCQSAYRYKPWNSCEKYC